VSDNGGPEDPEVEKLRQQLAAAEHVADLRAQLEAVNAGIDQFDSDIAKLESSSSSDTSAADGRSAGADSSDESGENVSSGSDGQDSDASPRKRRVALACLVIIIALAVLSPGIFNRETVEPSLTTSKGTKPSLTTSKGTKPSLTLECPKLRNTSDNYAKVKIGADWSWSREAGLATFRISYGDGQTSLTRDPTSSAIRELLEHSYRVTPRPFYLVTALLTDGFDRVVGVSCKVLHHSAPIYSSFEIGAILRSSYRYGEISERVLKLQNTIYLVTGTNISSSYESEGQYDARTRGAHIAALKKLGLGTTMVPGSS
jgi:hypothetical protein